eukprot:SAG11_NODE_85_length_17370_cov_29.272017_16_plen_50_part_00
MLLLAGSVDFDEMVSRKADDALRRLKIDLEDPQLIDKLFRLLLGTPRHR